MKRHILRAGLPCGIVLTWAASVLIVSPQTWPAGAHSIVEEPRIAVASNFARTATTLAERFEERTGHRVALVFGSTGKHFAQIQNGAPFHALLAADVRRPEILETTGVALANTRFTYAVGRLVLWSPSENYVDPKGEILIAGDFRHLAIANPRLAPYGAATRKALVSLGIWDRLSPRLVRGENIGQAFSFVRSGNAELGFVALSQILGEGGSYWEVPDTLHSPIEQQAVLLRDFDVARAFLGFVRSDEALSIIQAHGYDVP